jgi:dCMP deaminase
MQNEKNLELNVLTWDMRMLKLAQEVSTWSKDPSTQVGAVLINGKRHVKSVGYNGFPRKVEDDHRLHQRDKKLKIIRHAEVNAFTFCSDDPEGFCIYTYPFMPCSICAGAIIQEGVIRVVTFTNSVARWAEDFETARGMFVEAGVELVEYDS